jgi:outer membrane murein-binding lipoprotein Lpp
MRFVIATVLLIASGISVLLGFSIREPFAESAGKRVEFEVPKAYSYVLIPNSTLTSFDGEISIEASGSDEIFYADGRERDIQDWIGTSNYSRLNINQTTFEPDVSTVTSGGLDANPAGSDMWRSQLTVKNNLLNVVTMFDDTAVLLASNGLSRAPEKIAVIWDSKPLINWPQVLVIGGFVLLLAALIMNYVAFRHIRKLRGPRRRIPKSPTGPRYRRKVKQNVPVRGRRALGKSNRRRFMAAPVALVSLSLLAGCSSPTAEVEKPKYESVNVVVTEAQLQRIIADVATTVQDADAARDDKTLVKRVAGSALQIRKVQYLLQSKSKKIPKLPEIIANPITVALPMELPAPGLGWQPRTLMVVTNSESTTRAPQMLVLQQRNPRENYKLWYLIDLLPDENFPNVAAQAVGALPVAKTDSFLVTPLKSIPFKYGDTLNKGLESKYAPEFDLASDEFFAELSESQIQQKSEVEKVGSTIKFVHELGNQNILGLQTVERGGLIALAMNDTSTIKPKAQGAAVSVKALDQKLLLGSLGSSTGLKIVYSNMLLFYVPESGSGEKIRLVGASQGLLSVRSIN